LAGAVTAAFLAASFARSLLASRFFRLARDCSTVRAAATSLRTRAEAWRSARRALFESRFFMWDIDYSFLGALAAGAGEVPPEHFWQRLFL
jgi:hypothetical protein